MELEVWGILKRGRTQLRVRLPTGGGLLLSRSLVEEGHVEEDNATQMQVNAAPGSLPVAAAAEKAAAEAAATEAAAAETKAKAEAKEEERKREENRAFLAKHRKSLTRVKEKDRGSSSENLDA